MFSSSEFLPSDLNFDTSGSSGTSNSNDAWMRYTLASLNQSLESLTHELRETKSTLEAFVREEKKELIGKIDQQDDRVTALEQQVAVLSSRMAAVLGIAAAIGAAIGSIVITDVLHPPESGDANSSSSRTPSIIVAAADPDRSAADSTISKGK